VEENAVTRLAARIGAVVGLEIELERPKDPAHGDFATNVAMRSAKAAGKPPRELAEELAGKIAALAEIESAEVAGPGFINLRVGDPFLLDALGEMGEHYGGGFVERPERVQVEMVSANPTGPIVVSAARNGAYGDCVARLLARSNFPQTGPVSLSPGERYEVTLPMDGRLLSFLQQSLGLGAMAFV